VNVIRFPRPFRRQPEQPSKPHPIRDAAKRRMRALIALAVEVFDLLDGPEPPDTEAAQPRRSRLRRKAPQQGGTI
jgi:hypothetical protein